MTAQAFPKFFLLASFDAMVAVGALLPVFLGYDLSGVWPGSVFGWHGHELLVGYVSCVLSGFLLTALPRWTKRTPGRATETLLLVAWLAGRLAFALPPAFAVIGAAPSVLLAALVSFHVIAAKDWRNVKVIALLWVFAAGGLCAMISAGAAMSEFGLRLGLAAAIGLVMIIGGRIVPSLTQRCLLLRGEKSAISRSSVVEMLAAVGGSIGLLVWLIHPVSRPMAFASILAATTQLLRLAQWRCWSVIETPSVFVLHLGYGFIPLGFALLSAAFWLPRSVPLSAGLHAWTVGAIGLMTLAVMASMIRRRTGRSFVLSRTGLCVYVFAVSALVIRIAAEFSAWRGHWLALAATCWIFSFAFFVYDFRTPLLARA